MSKLPPQVRKKEIHHHVVRLPPTRITSALQNKYIVDGTRYIVWHCVALTMINNYNHYVYFCELLTNLRHESSPSFAHPSTIRNQLDLGARAQAADGVGAQFSIDAKNVCQFLFTTILIPIPITIPL